MRIKLLVSKVTAVLLSSTDGPPHNWQLLGNLAGAVTVRAGGRRLPCRKMTYRCTSVQHLNFQNQCRAETTARTTSLSKHRTSTPCLPTVIADGAGLACIAYVACVATVAYHLAHT